MGKRKSSRPKAAPAKKMAKLETAFCCPFCNHAESVSCRISRKRVVATAPCYICLARYSTKAHALTEPIDIYADWIDECDRVNKGLDTRAFHDAPHQDDE